jgi:Zn-finger nucleic acid-binding protein
VVEFADIELDSCPECGGLWFDRGEMELLAARCGCSVELLAARSGSHVEEARLKCPTCRRTMDKKLFGEGEPVVGDVCSHCGGLWLDAGELLQVLAQGGTDLAETGAAQSPIVGYLREAFGSRNLGRADTPASERRACE